MATYRRPGVYADEVLNPSASSSQSGASVAAFVGTNGRGPTSPTLVQSWADYVGLFGGFNTVYGAASALPYALYQFFGNGGRNAYVTRVLPSDAVTATVDFYDGAGVTANNKVLTFTAANGGAWAGGSTASGYTYGLGFEVVRSGATPFRFDLNIYYFPAGAAPAATAAANSPYLVEKWQDLSMNAGDSRYAPAVVNPSSVSGLAVSNYSGGSRYVTVTDARSATPVTPNIAPAATTSVVTISTNGVATAASGNINGLAVLGTDGTALITGTGGSASLAYYKAVMAHDWVPGNLVFNLPAVSDPYTLAAVIDYVGNRGDCFLVIDSASGRSPGDPNAGSASGSVLSDFQPFVSGGAAYSNNPATTVSNGNAPQVVTNTGYAAIYYPWLTIGDPGAPTPGLTRSVPPGGAVVGQYQQNDAVQGPWFAPAGISTTVNAVGVERRLSNPELDGLNSPGTIYNGVYPFVNPIRIMPGAGICIYGARTLRSGFPDRYINVRRTLIDLKYNLSRLTQFAVFEANDELLWTQLTSVCNEYLMGVWQNGGLRGATAQQAFFVKCDGTTNTDTQVQNGEVRIQVGVAVQYPAEFVIITIGQFDGSTTVNEG